jgi:hypothetical protein
MPRRQTALVYPGQVLLEGTNLSEGRGTTTPFEVCGAPFIDPRALVRELDACSHPGLALRPIRFVPTFDKWRGQSRGGIYLRRRSDRGPLGRFHGVAARRCERAHPETCGSRPYEYEQEKCRSISSLARQSSGTAR